MNRACGGIDLYPWRIVGNISIVVDVGGRVMVARSSSTHSAPH